MYISLTDSYVCILFLSCFEEIQGTDNKGTQVSKLPAGSTLHTAKELLTSEEVFDFITMKMAEIQEHETISNDKSTSKGKGKPDP